MTTMDNTALFEQYLYNFVKKTINESKKTPINEANESDDPDNNDKVSKERRKVVIAWLKNDAVNGAEIMRQLWKPKPNEEDAKRSYFYKCRDGVMNDNGIPYNFSSVDINSLFKIKSNNQ